MYKSHSLVRATQYCFSKSTVEVFCVRDNPYGFEGQILQVKPGFYEQFLHPRGYALINKFGFRKRILPEFDQETLQAKLDRKQKVTLAMQKIASFQLEFIRPPLFSNPSQTKQPISEQEIIDELESRFKFTLTKRDLNLPKKISYFGQTTVMVDNFYIEDLGKSVTFPIKVILKMNQKPGSIQGDSKKN